MVNGLRNFCNNPKKDLCQFNYWNQLELFEWKWITNRQVRTSFL